MKKCPPKQIRSNSGTGEGTGRLVSWLSSFAGLSNLSNDLRPGPPELRIRLHEGAVGLGLDAEGMARQLWTAFQSTTADEIQVGSESSAIDVRLTHQDRDSLADFESFYSAFSFEDGCYTFGTDCRCRGSLDHGHSAEYAWHLGIRLASGNRRERLDLADTLPENATRRGS